MDMVRTGEIAPLELIRRLTSTPARIFRLPGGTLARGAQADVVLLDPDATWTYDPAEGYSKSRNSPWAEEKLTGQVMATWVGGELMYQAGRGVVAK